jgi:hypothetical protein
MPVNQRRMDLKFLVDEMLPPGFPDLNQSRKARHTLEEIDFTLGGQWLVDAVKKYGVNEVQEPLRWNPLLEETLLLIGDFRFGKVSVTGAAQVHKSLSGWQLAAALLTVAGKNWMWVYADGEQITKLVPTQFIPIVESWERSLGLARKSSPRDSKSMKIWQSQRGTGRFVSANNPRANSASESGLAAAGKGAVAAPTDLLQYDEASQSSEEAKEPFQRRTLQSSIPSRPVRSYGTPGRGAGIELDIAIANYDFYPFIKCSSCGVESALHPFGWLLKNSEPDQNKPPKYLDEIGRPIQLPDVCHWHHTDPADPINSAIYACPYCEAPVTREERLTAWFQCRKSNVRLKDLVRSLPTEFPDRPISAGITLSPLIRDARNSGGPASIIGSGIAAKNPQDWQQQELGVPSSTATGGITREMIERSLISKINHVFTKKIQGWGLDQGTKEHWLAIVNYRLAEQLMGCPAPTAQQIYLESHREVIFLGKINESEVANRVRSCTGGAIDVDPFRDWAGNIRKQLPRVVLADQRGKKEMADVVAKPSEVEIGGRSLPVILCDTHQIQTYILNLFTSEDPHTGDCRIKLPSTVRPSDMSDDSAMRHLTTSTRDGATGVWARPLDHNDDLLKALMFAELWFWLYCHGQLPAGNFDWEKMLGKS